MSKLYTRETDSERESWRSTDTLPDETRERVRRLLGEAVEDMDRLDRIISEKEADLAHLYQKREVDSARISSLRGVISKARKLPPEILSEVFTHVCAESQVELPLKKREGWWIVGHVCSHWRQVLWSSPGVWANIYICDLQYEERSVMAQHHRTIPKVLEHIFANTNTLLSLHVFGNELPLAYETILSHSHRFRALCLRGIDWKTILSIVALPSQTFINLETLQLFVQDDGDLPPLPTSNVSSFQNAVNLRSVTYSCYVEKGGSPRRPNRIFTPRFLVLPWEHLTDLSISFMPIPPSELHAIFSRCLALVTCKVLCTGDPVIPMKHSITLRSLKVFEVSTNYYHETVDWVNFLGPLVTPSLKELAIRALTMSCQAFASLITRSKCPLATLNLQPHDITFQDPHVEAILPHLGSLTTLCLGFPVAASVIRNIHDGLIPSLTYGEWVVQPDGWEAVLDLIDLRIQRRFSPAWKLSVDLVCLGGRGFGGVRDRYLRRFLEYQGIEGLSLNFWDAEEGREIEPDDDKYR